MRRSSEELEKENSVQHTKILCQQQLIVAYISKHNEQS